MIRVLLHARKSLSAETLWAAMKGQPGVEAVALTETEEQLFREVERTLPQAVLLMPEAAENGPYAAEVMFRLRTTAPNTSVIVLYQHRERQAVVNAFRAGARGVFTIQDSSLEELGKCIEHVQAGHVWASWQDMEWLIQGIEPNGGQAEQPRFVDERGRRILSQREQEVVSLLMAGLPNREIAQALKLSEHTIKNYLFRIYDKLGISSRTELLVYAMAPRRAERPGDTARS